MAASAHSQGPLGRKVSLAQLDLILAGLEALPPIDGDLARALEARPGREGPAPSSGWEAMAELACADPCLAGRLLSLANGAGGAPVAVPSAAVKQLGLPAARLAVLGALGATEKTAPLPGPGDRREFWRHCLGVAHAARLLAERADLRVDGEEAFTWGLLHDLGKPAFWALMPKSHARAVEACRQQDGSLAAHEQAVIGVDHAVFGRHLASQWRLPEALVQVIWLHHQPPEVFPPDSPERLRGGLVNLADTIARELSLGWSGSLALACSSAELAGQLDLDPAAVQEVKDALPGQLADHMQHLLGQIEAAIDPRRRDQPAPRPSSQLLAEAQTARRQAAAMEQLRALAASLRPDATVPQVLQAIAEGFARSAGESQEAPPIVAYCMEPDCQAVLALRPDSPGQAQTRRLTARTADWSQAPSAAAEAMSELLQEPSELGDWLDLATAEHWPLRSAGTWIGGVLRGPSSPDNPPQEPAMMEVAGAWLALARQQARAVRVGEQLSAAWGTLAAGQQSLAEAKALSAVAELAAGAAHEINNPLAVISGRAQLMRSQAASEAERKVWQLIVDQAQRISDIITGLMELVSPPAGRPEAIAPRGLLEEAAEAFRRSDHPQARSCQVDIDTAAPLPELWADRRQVAAVLGELLANAAAVSAGRARIRLGAQAQPSQAAVLLTVADDGPGMDEPTAAMAFTPFFSRQAAGRRRGLGLPRARRVLESNGGRIWIRSRPGAGTTVTVQLPHRPAGQPPADASRPPAAE